METARILALGGDGIGPEVVACGLEVLERVATLAGIALRIDHDLLGGASWDRHGTMCRDEVVETAMSADAVLVGAVGGPQWDGLDIPGGPTDKDGLVRLRKEMDVFACIRPARSVKSLLNRTPFKPSVIDGTDIIVLRELCGGVYFGEPRGIRVNARGEREGFDSNHYTHPVGTCRMGASDAAHSVVDPQLRVLGLEGLRVVDASIIPRQIRANPNSTIIAIAERASDLILGRPVAAPEYPA